MRIFEHGNWNETTEPCPVCGRKDPGPVVLVGIAGTEDGHNIQARQYHVACIDLIEQPVLLAADYHGVILVSQTIIKENIDD